jgi:hypothetical protein
VNRAPKSRRPRSGRYVDDTGGKRRCGFIRKDARSTQLRLPGLRAAGLASFCALEPSRTDLERESGRS